MVCRRFIGVYLLVRSCIVKICAPDSPSVPGPDLGLRNSSGLVWPLPNHK
jgi:hypothetical protein